MLPRSGAPAILLLLVGASGAFAQVGLVFNRTGSGARAAGMANAFIAISDDGSAASWNPAGLAQLRKPELSLVSTTAGHRLRNEGFRAPDDLSTFTPALSSYRNTYLDFASLAAPVTLWGKPVTFQAGWRRLYSLDYRETIATVREPLAPGAPASARIHLDNHGSGGVDLVSITGAVKLTPRLALGGCFNLWRGDWTDNQAVHVAPLSGPELPEFRTANQTNRVRGENVSLGLLLTYPRWSVGLLHQSPLVSDYGNETRVTTSDQPAQPPLALEGALRFPRSVGIGGAWHPSQPWTVALDLTWDEWSDTTLDTPSTDPVSLFDGLPLDRTSTRDTISINAGAEHLFLGDGFVVPLRFGAAWEPQGGRSPYTRDGVDFALLAVGTGYNTNSLKFDAAFQFRWAHFQDATDFALTEPADLLPGAIGERGLKEWRLKLSLILRVTDTDKLRRTVRKVFGGT